MLPVITHVCSDEKTALTILVHVLYVFFLVMSVARWSQCNRFFFSRMFWNWHFFSMIFVKLSHTQVMVFNENQYRSGALAIFGASSFLVAYFLDSYGATPKNVDRRTLLRTHRSRCDLRLPSFRDIFLMGHQMEHFSTWNMSHSDAFAVWSSDEGSFPTNSFWCLGDYPCATEASHALQSLFLHGWTGGTKHLSLWRVLKSDYRIGKIRRYLRHLNTIPICHCMNLH